MDDCTLKLTQKQIKRLKKMYTNETGKVARRAHIVLLRNQFTGCLVGTSCSEVRVPVYLPCLNPCFRWIF